MSDKELLVDQATVRRLFNYDPDTGIFTRLKRTSPNAMPRMVAGTTNAGGYIQININGCLYYAHRLAWLYMNGSWPDKKIDHVNRVRSDNRFCNLRKSSDSQNSINQNLTHGVSGYRGVSFCKRRNYWYARIRMNKKASYLGAFSRPEHAAAAYNAAAIVVHGEFAMLNKIPAMEV